MEKLVFEKNTLLYFGLFHGIKNALQTSWFKQRIFYRDALFKVMCII